jgi:hypothetical protein
MRYSYLSSHLYFPGHLTREKDFNKYRLFTARARIASLKIQPKKSNASFNFLTENISFFRIFIWENGNEAYDE